MAGGWRDQRGVKGHSRVETSVLFPRKLQSGLCLKGKRKKSVKTGKWKMPKREGIEKQVKQEEVNSWAPREEKFFL